MLYLVLGLIVGAAAGPDPARLFAPEQPIARANLGRLAVPRGGHSMISSTARQQGAVIIEQFLAKSDNGCLARAMCQYGARKATGRFVTDMTIEDAWDKVQMIIKDAWNTVKDKWEEIFGDDAERSNMKQLIGAIEVGEAMGYDTCRSLFECSEDFFQVQQARITCDGAGKICPGFSIGCALCGLYAPAVCGSTCTVAALYCGFGGYACAAEADEPATTVAPMLPPF